jgi:hypothetical protein
MCSKTDCCLVTGVNECVTCTVVSCGACSPVISRSISARCKLYCRMCSVTDRCLTLNAVCHLTPSGFCLLVLLSAVSLNYVLCRRCCCCFLLLHSSLISRGRRRKKTPMLLSLLLLLFLLLLVLLLLLPAHQWSQHKKKMDACYPMCCVVMYCVV